MDNIKADNRMIIQGEKYRFTVLTPCLIRMEYSETGKFIDNATQKVVNRNFNIPEFHVEDTEEELKITTSHLRLTYTKKKFSATSLKINIDGNYEGVVPVWHYGDKFEDLKGTARTLDEADGAIPLESGILSKGGWSLLDDKGSMVIGQDHWIMQREDPEAEDLYFFGYGREYIKCLKDFHILTGSVPLLPKYALGNWWSRYYKYTEESYLQLMDRFAKEKIPFTVSVIDMDWHITEVDPKYGTGWTGYTWNKDFFPNPERFMEELHKRGLKVTLNVHPADGIRAFEDCYERFAEYMGVDTKEETPIDFQPADSRFMKGYFEEIHHPMEQEGVDFWWIDWQQGNNSGVEGLDPLWILNHYHYMDSKRNGNRGLIFSRYAGPGSHRYPVGFSGDTIISWESLDFQPYFTATASNIGYGWWSHDIGGHMNGIKNDELAVRWLQFGVFSPIMRLHSTCNEFNGKEPWRYNLIAENIMKRYLRLRHKMIPYLNTMNLRASKESIPLVQPMYYHNAMEEKAYHVPNEYYFGSELIVCPVTKPVDKETGLAEFKAWLPEGKWMDVFSGIVYKGNRNIVLYRGIEDIPVLLKQGGCLPMDGREEGNDLENTDISELHIFADGCGEFTLWEDCPKNENADWASTKIEVSCEEDAVVKIHAAQGNKEILPKQRAYIMYIGGIGKFEEIEITAGKDVVKDSFPEQCEDTQLIRLNIPKLPTDQDITIRIKAARKSDNQIERRIFNFLNKAEIEFNLKTEIMNVIREGNQESPAYILGQILAMELPSGLVGPLAEIITAN